MHQLISLRAFIVVDSLYPLSVENFNGREDKRDSPGDFYGRGPGR